MKPTKCPAREKKKWGKKSEKRGEERKRKVKVKTAVSLLNPKTLEILLSAHARTSQADTFASVSEGREEYDLQTALW